MHLPLRRLGIQEPHPSLAFIHNNRNSSLNHRLKSRRYSLHHMLKSILNNPCIPIININIPSTNTHLLSLQPSHNSSNPGVQPHLVCFITNI